MRIFLLFLAVTSIFLTGFTFRLVEDLGNFDWGNGEVSQPVVQQLMEGLTVSGHHGEPRSALAKSWRLTGNGTRLRFTLRHDARWSDGEPVCARHFVDAWTRVLSPEFASPYAHLLFDIAGAREFHAGKIKDAARLGIRANGCHELDVSLAHPAAYFPALASHHVLFPVRLDLIKKYGKEWTRPGKLVVTGPYLLEKWTPDSEIVLARNAKYYGARPSEENLKALIVGDDATALTLFRAGTIDWMKDLPFLEKPRLSKLAEYKAFPSFVEYHLGFNMSEVPREARCALSLAIDRRRIPEILGGQEQPAAGFVPPGLYPGARGEPAYDAERARRLWQGVESKHRPVELHYYAKDIHSVLMQWVQQEWKRVLGAEIKLVKLEGKTYWSLLQAKPPAVFLSGTTAAYAHPYAFLSEFLSDSKANWGHFSSRAYDSAAIKATGTSLERSRSLIDLAERILLAEECAAVPLYFRQTSSLISKRSAGVFVNPMTYIYMKDISTKH